MATMATSDEDDYGIPLVKNVESADQRTKESLRDVEKQDQKFFLLTKMRILLARSRRVCCIKIKNKLSKCLTLGLMPAMKEWVAKKGQTLLRRVMLSTFSFLLCFCLTCTSRWTSRRSKLALRLVKC